MSTTSPMYARPFHKEIIRSLIPSMKRSAKLHERVLLMAEIADFFADTNEDHR